MKKFLLTIAILFPAIVYAQLNLYVFTIAGNHDTSYVGDGHSALNNAIGTPRGICRDNIGNIYIADNLHSVVRKINNFGIISTIAGTGVSSYSGDGGPATAATLKQPYSVRISPKGDVYIVDEQSCVVRKINSSGIISTAVGTGISGNTGDGGPATSARLALPTDVAFDKYCNMYIWDVANCKIRKVDTNGIITTYAGNGICGFSGDGGPATAANLTTSTGSFITCDKTGNLFITTSPRVRKVDTFGIISTVAGNGSTGYMGDGIPATDCGMQPLSLCIDKNNNLNIGIIGGKVLRVDSSGIVTQIAGYGGMSYSEDCVPADSAVLGSQINLVSDSNNIVALDVSNNKILSIRSYFDISSDSMNIFFHRDCDFKISVVTNHFVAGQHIKTFFGNGLSADSSLTLSSGVGTTAFFPHYTISGTYTIKHILYFGATAIDSISYSYNYVSCNSLKINLFDDIHDSCVFSSSTPLNHFPVTLEVDFNGTVIDTISALAGFQYTAYGNVGDIYAFKVINLYPGLVVNCPSSGIIYDTLYTGLYPEKSIGLRCDSSAGLDLAVYMFSRPTPFSQLTMILAQLSSCSLIPAIVSLNYSSQYTTFSAYPTPTSISGHFLTWNLGILDYTSANTIEVIATNTTGLIPGDTAMNSCVIDPTTGDVDTSNNHIRSIDTVRGSWDPNEMFVTPSGIIAAGTQLEYTVMFENTGNDTAHNIFVMDTLSDALVPSTMRMIVASSTMNVAKIYDSVYHNIYKFEFPCINLLDSSHHNQCDGMFKYKIRTRTGLTNGTFIRNHAGIYFDDNAVVTTDTVTNVIGIPVAVNPVPAAPRVSLFPNPATNALTVNSTDYQSLTICDMMGHILINQAIIGNSFNLNITSIPAGVYYVTFYGEYSMEVKKFVKM